VDNFLNGRRLQQSLWEDLLEHVTKNNEGEGNGFCDRVRPKSQKKAVKGSESFTCTSGDVDLRNANREIKTRRVHHEMTNLILSPTDT